MTWGMDEPIHPTGRAMEPLEVVRALRWIGDLKPDEIVTAILHTSRADPADIARRFPDCSAEEIAVIQERASRMTGSRLRAWNAAPRGRLVRRPTWPEVRALIFGLQKTL